MIRRTRQSAGGMDDSRIQSLSTQSSDILMCCRFEINDDNVRDLAYLADKYIINSLRKLKSSSVRSIFVVKYSDTIRVIRCKYISRAETPTLELWYFAAKYSFVELEQYCRSNSSVNNEIKVILANSTEGVKFLLNDQGIPLAIINEIVSKYVQEAVSWELAMSLLICMALCRVCNEI